VKSSIILGKFLLFCRKTCFSFAVECDIMKATLKGSVFMKIMGVDYGDARTGIAISDLMCTIVGSTYVIPSRNREKAVADIVRLVKENTVGEIAVGLPRNMDGSEGARAELCREFAAVLEEATGVKTVMWDERRTTVEAHNILSQHNYHGQKRKNTVDAVAASLILEGYLAFRGR
jgi:putative Holliday junction resolvase